MMKMATASAGANVEISTLRWACARRAHNAARHAASTNQNRGLRIRYRSLVSAHERQTPHPGVRAEACRQRARFRRTCGAGLELAVRVGFVGREAVLAISQG